MRSIQLLATSLHHHHCHFPWRSGWRKKLAYDGNPDDLVHSDKKGGKEGK